MPVQDGEVDTAPLARTLLAPPTFGGYPVLAEVALRACVPFAARLVTRPSRGVPDSPHQLLGVHISPRGVTHFVAGRQPLAEKRSLERRTVALANAQKVRPLLRRQGELPSNLFHERTIAFLP